MEDFLSDDGDDSWFVTEVTVSQSALAGLAFSLLANRTGAEEVLQETNLVLWKKRAEFEQGTNFKAWAFRVLRFQAMAYLKREKRRSRKEVLAFDEDILEKLSTEATTVLDKQGHRVAALRDCLRKLPATDRRLIEGHYLDGGLDDSTMEKQAAAIGRSVGAFRQVLYRIRNSLRLCIDKTLSEEGVASV